MPRFPYAPLAELPPSRPRSPSGAKRSDLYVLILALTWLTVAAGAIVFTEPAPFDALMMGLIVLLPIAGLAVFSPGLLLMLAAWLIIAGAGFGAAMFSLDITKSVTHTVVTLYLSLAAFVLAGFILKKPEAHMRLVMNAYMWSAVLSALLGIIGSLFWPYINAALAPEDLTLLLGFASNPIRVQCAILFCQAFCCLPYVPNRNVLTW